MCILLVNITEEFRVKKGLPGLMGYFCNGKNLYEIRIYGCANKEGSVQMRRLSLSLIYNVR